MVTAQGFFRKVRYTLPATLLLLAAQAVGSLAPLGMAHAAPVPVSGHTPWAIVLCKFADQPQEPQTQQFFQDFFSESGAGKGGMFDYWESVSYGAVDLTGTTVTNWHTVAETLDDAKKMDRYSLIKSCIDAAKDDVYFPNYYGIVAVFNADVEAGSVGRLQLTLDDATKTYGLLNLAPWSYNVTFTAHEMGHGYGLDHSWSANPDTEYGDAWDIMSAMNVNSYDGGQFGTSGPELNAPYRDLLGWMPAGRTYNWGQGGASSGAPLYASTINLAPLNHPEANGYLMAKIPLDATDPNHYYTVEFRRKNRFDAGIPNDTVLVHEMRDDGLSYLIPVSDTGSELLPGMVFHDPVNNVRISFEQITPPPTVGCYARSRFQARCSLQLNSTSYSCIGPMRSDTASVRCDFLLESDLTTARVTISFDHRLGGPQPGQQFQQVGG